MSFSRGRQSAMASGRSPDSVSQTRKRICASDRRRPSRFATGGAEIGGVENQYSGATVRDSHPLPYSPRTAVRGTRSHSTISKDQSLGSSKPSTRLQAASTHRSSQSRLHIYYYKSSGGP